MVSFIRRPPDLSGSRGYKRQNGSSGPAPNDNPFLEAVVTSISQQKDALRLEAKRIRAASFQMHGTAAAEAAASHAKKLLSVETAGTVIGLYYPKGDELDPRFLQQYLEQQGFQTALPTVTAHENALTFKLWGQGDPLIRGAFGIEEPEPEAPTVDPDILIIPLLAYDEQAYRMGWGGGFYDRTIVEYPEIRTFGFAYAAQIVDHVPRESHDMPLHGIITETGILFPKRG